MARKIGILKEFLPALLPKYKIMLLEAFSPHDLLTAYIKNTLSGYPRLEDQNLDDLTVEDVERELGMRLAAVEPGGKEFMDAILDPEYTMDRNNDNFVYIKAYDRDIV